MGNMLARGADFLARKILAGGSESITVTRGAQAITIPAVYGRTPYQSMDASGLILEWLSHDFVVKAVDFTIGTPARGDRITKTINGATQTFEVLAPHGQPVFQSDAYDTLYRIHTKQVNA